MQFLAKHFNPLCNLRHGISQEATYYKKILLHHPYYECLWQTNASGGAIADADDGGAGGTVAAGISAISIAIAAGWLLLMMIIIQ